jgi:hypothetical protein
VSTLVITTDKATYAPGDPIIVTLSTDGQMVQTVTVTGEVTETDGTELPAETSTTVDGIWGPVSAPGYTTVQHPDAPNVFTLTPATS